MHNPCDTCICRNISFLLEHHKCDPDLQFLTLEQSPSSLPGFKNLTFDSVYGIILCHMLLVSSYYYVYFYLQFVSVLHNMK